MFLDVPEISFFLFGAIDIIDIVGIEVDDISCLASDLIIEEFLLLTLQLHLRLHIREISSEGVHLIRELLLDCLHQVGQVLVLYLLHYQVYQLLLALQTIS